MALLRDPRRARPVLRLAVVAALLPVAACSSDEGEAPPVDSAPVTTSVTSASEDATAAGSRNDVTFADGVLTTPELRIEITRYEVIGPGEKGNERGKTPILAFWYDTTNVSGALAVTPLDFLLHLTAYQDSNPGASNELVTAPTPDDRFRDSEFETIADGATVANAVAYELEDAVTPVDLVATDGFDEPFGQTTYDIS